MINTITYYGSGRFVPPAILKLMHLKFHKLILATVLYGICELLTNCSRDRNESFYRSVTAVATARMEHPPTTTVSGGLVA
jgi:hypothetical protein